MELGLGKILVEKLGVDCGAIIRGAKESGAVKLNIDSAIVVQGIYHGWMGSKLMKSYKHPFVKKKK
jgi:hypothetical protein